MSKVAGCKRKLKTRTITEKYKILKEVEKGESSASISRKYGIPKQTLSGWLKEKTKIYSEVEKNKTSAKRDRMRLSLHEDLDKACYMWLLNVRHQSIPVSGTIFKAKALNFAKELGCDSFQASDGWLDRWKKRHNVSFKTISGIFSFDHILIFTYFWKVSYLKYLCNHFVHEIIISMELSSLFHRLN